MNPSLRLPALPELAVQLRRFAGVCDDVLALVSREAQTLAGAREYPAFEFYQGRKALLLRLDEGLNLLRQWRLAWQRLDAVQRSQDSEVKVLLQTVQDSLVKILVLDRENQQALLRRGAVPATHLPAFRSHPPHYAAQVYRRHSS
jgi:hypothetical protein